MSQNTIPGLFLNSERATKAYRLVMSLVELKDMAGESVPGPEMPTSA
jgi:hypothetical protein